MKIELLEYKIEAKEGLTIAERKQLIRRMREIIGNKSLNDLDSNQTLEDAEKSLDIIKEQLKMLLLSVEKDGVTMAVDEFLNSAYDYVLQALLTAIQEYQQDLITKKNKS